MGELKKKSKAVRIDYAAPEVIKKKKKKPMSESSAVEEPIKKKKKKRLTEIENDSDAPRKKKKKRKEVGTALVVVQTEEPKKGSLEKAKGKQARLQAKIAAELAQIETMPAASSQEKEQLDEYLHMFRKLAKLIRKAEKQCMKSGQSRDYYALCTLMSQQREVIADIRSVSDMSGQVAALENNVLQPLIRSIGQNTLDVFYQIRKLLVHSCKPEETQFALAKLNEITQEQGKYLQSQYSLSVEKVGQIMLG